MIRALTLAVVLVGTGCTSSTSSDPDLKVKNETPKGSAGGFSASLGAELAMGSGGAATPGPGTGATGSTTATGTTTGTGSPAGTTGTGTTGSPTTGAPGTTAGSATTTTGAGPAGTSSAGTGATTGTSTTTAPAPPSAPVKVPADLAAIQLSLLPNWDRDAGEAGTISLFVKVQRTGQSELFKFYYGYEDPKAPADREAYKKFLADTKALTVVNDRQRSTAWLLEGKDASGGQAFRIVVLYGGKRLICYGSLYQNSPLGDFRDEVVNQAKKICESISL